MRAGWSQRRRQRCESSLRLGGERRRVSFSGGLQHFPGRRANVISLKIKKKRRIQVYGVIGWLDGEFLTAANQSLKTKLGGDAHIRVGPRGPRAAGTGRSELSITASSLDRSATA